MDPIFEIKENKSTEKYAIFELSPLPAGYGSTMGTALRRVLLSSLKGAAITQVRIKGVQHQFSTLKGMKEDVLDLLLNLKKVRFVYTGDDSVSISLSTNKPGEVKAADISTPSNVKVANPELVLATLSEGTKFDIDMVVSSGTGYALSEEHKTEEIGTIPLDASFSPVE